MCLFGVDVEQLGDGLGVTATMAHEVAHAFRSRFGLALTDPERIDEEERLTDLTTIYLGAGVLTTNGIARSKPPPGCGSVATNGPFARLAICRPRQ